MNEQDKLLIDFLEEGFSIIECKDIKGEAEVRFSSSGYKILKALSMKSLTSVMYDASYSFFKRAYELKLIDYESGYIKHYNVDMGKDLYLRGNVAVITNKGKEMVALMDSMENL